MRDALAGCKPDAVAIPGWSEKGALVALRWCVDNSVPAILMSETSEIDEPRTSLKEFAKRRVVGLCSAGLVGGQRHKDYLVKLGMAPDRIFLGYDAVDNGFFAQGAKEVGSRKEKGENGLPEPPTREATACRGNYFLASARFIRKKNLDTLIRAYSEFRRKTEDGRRRAEESVLQSPASDLGPPASDLGPPSPDLWDLVILGDGPLKSQLCSLISDLHLEQHVIMPGFKQYEELPIHYGLANAFIHASTSEQWGLVVNEAMASGLPVIVSNRCGCAPELVEEGINGFTFDPDDQEQLANRLLEMASLSSDGRQGLGDAGRRIVANFGLERFADGLTHAAEKALEIGPRKPTFLQRVVLAAGLGR